MSQLKGPEGTWRHRWRVPGKSGVSPKRAVVDLESEEVAGSAPDCEELREAREDWSDTLGVNHYSSGHCSRLCGERKRRKQIWNTADVTVWRRSATGVVTPAGSVEKESGEGKSGLLQM